MEDAPEALSGGEYMEDTPKALRLLKKKQGTLKQMQFKVGPPSQKIKKQHLVETKPKKRQN